MDDQTILDIKAISGLVSESWKAMVILSGITAGFFDELSLQNPVSINTIIGNRNYCLQKVEMWFSYAESLGIIEKLDNTYRLTSKGVLLSNASPYKDLLGLIQITDYFMQSAVNSKENFKVNNSQDSLTKGRITNEYQSRVTNNLSAAVIDIFKKFNVKAEDSLLDLGCGNGNLLRSLKASLPLMELTGVDLNKVAIRSGKKRNKEQNITDIKLLKGDVVKHLDIFTDHSYDWTSGINLLHFIDKDFRIIIIDNMLRLSRKGIFFTETIIELSELSASANPLLSLLWNDFTGFFKKAESDALNEEIKKKYPGYTVHTIPIIQGTSNMVIVIKENI